MSATEKGYSGALGGSIPPTQSRHQPFQKPEAQYSVRYQYDAGKMSALTVVLVSTPSDQGKNLFQNAAQKFAFVKILFS